ncbi:hypothetical protein COU62_04550 [Candidatus Pacearchaeota archaeon CG10_big_fil_rev_8_21_14_0_10_35_219]|nr:MAG: hypothetical protein AUJ63_04975 [Candidatus Pacearchaeota archaeon CG1_02_35_32]PIO07261.1 MAG: hypothetical protein COU62_04550 [Candidatus Pacearchaeota archaeon CG10_big_fil_rev_8_21_14_0_10_35_219]PIY81171.1 MAG: hypothetical protein COY79_03965 [Candidatus Pacearchaeota archaeon CG_4_10_14_0_8_um_filter_35_169]PIZ79422.1 MAG: hypothetical protein COY00_03970 [Candidatus Pacearchaeota archaeon CG_4_10_14_0_2_um_filter_35_33]PJB93986.1 MAG: hypothetical protein CO081_03495 [Candidat
MEYPTSIMGESFSLSKFKKELSNLLSKKIKVEDRYSTNKSDFLTIAIESKKVFVKVKSVKEAKLKIEGHKKVKGHYPIPSLVHIMVFQDRVALIYEFEETVKEKDGGLFLDCLGLHPLEKEAFEKVIGIYIKSYKKNSTFKRLPSIFIFQR